MTGAEFKVARIAAGLSYRLAAEALGVALSTIQRWEAAEEVPAAASAALAALTTASRPPDTAYVLGRVVCALERRYGRSFPNGIWTTIEARPALGLAQALRLTGAPRRDPAIGELLALLPPELPERGTAVFMAAFWIGYWHQRAELRATADPD